MHFNDVDAIPFQPASFLNVISQRSKQKPSGPLSNGHQAQYLANYLGALGAKSLVCENHYIDRHFMEEVGNYYSRCLQPTDNFTSRLHAFSVEIDSAKLQELLIAAAQGQQNDVRIQLQDAYLGYIVIRPLASVPIGRTVLRPMPAESGRTIPTVYRYPVHFLGLELEVSGLAFQQQDRAVAACASTAVWCALQRVCRRDGARPPTSSEITAAAVRNYLPFGRPFPSSGLTIEQICEALRSFEFPPDLFMVSGYPDVFLGYLSTYLRSGIPVIMALAGTAPGEEGHAITAVGFKRNFSAPSRPFGNIPRAKHENLDFTKLYIHDDRLGPYARSELRQEALLDEHGNPRVDRVGTPLHRLLLDIEFPNQQIETRQVICAAAPLYPKLRSNARELYETAVEFLPLVAQLFASPNDVVGFETYFDRSGGYQRELFNTRLDPNRVADFQRKIVLSRYVGVIRWTVNGSRILDTVWDTTDTLRETKLTENLLAFVCFEPRLRSITDTLGTMFNVLTA